jgi:drug/metabolite transporter (DMT)-like permease
MIVTGLGAGSFYRNIMALLTAGCFPAFAITVCRSRNIEMIPALLIYGANISLISLIILGGDLSISFPDLLLCILLGTFVSAIQNAFFITASRYLIAAELTLFMLLEFVLVPILVRIFIKEISGQATLICEVIVIIVVLLRVWFEMRESRAL